MTKKSEQAPVDETGGLPESGIESSDARPSAGVFSVVREKWLASAMIGLGAATAILWAAQPSAPERASITASLRDIPSEVAPIPSAAEAAERVGAAASQPTRADARDQLARVPSRSVDQLETRFERYGYTLHTVKAQQADVPRIVPETVPQDLKEVREVERKKEVFLRMVLPLVLMVNERLSEQRDRLVTLSEKIEAGQSIGREQRVWLNQMYETYRVEPGEIERLLLRVDVVPPSLALAQAAIESGWGTSRFAREGNALFGQWVWGDDADGIVPERRQEGKTHKIRAFETPLEAVAAYIKNLNTHRAYAKLRRMRAELRAQGAGLNGLTLAGGLEAYSEKGQEYVDLVRQIIAANELRPLDKARLVGARRRDGNV
ncbi:MAG: glucosaminidase domain-containing protein [Marivibrio sp.]|uniref:glucosaminidase domain-containing protein n=1 Tax=Marivibrio sp. TaxID=2039719 RepID=UPI0032EF0662